MSTNTDQRDAARRSEVAEATQTPRATPLLSARAITKNFGSTKALVDARIDLRPGEVCGLLGANGAGKSTLSRIISGNIAATSGQLVFDGKPCSFGSTRDALSVGIALVAQETSLAPDMSVLENIFLPDLAMPGRLSFSKLRTRAKTILSGLGHEHALPLDQQVRTLSAAQRQLVEIAKALAMEARLVIFDEPTASLSAIEVDRLFNIMSRLCDNGKALVFVSHRMEEVFAITDRVTILREGSCVADDLETTTLTQTDIIRHMVGKDIGKIYEARTIEPNAFSNELALEVENLKAEPSVRDISFSVKRGEILGLGGLVGAGRSEAVEAIFGLRPRQAGNIRVAGKSVKLRKPADAVAAGLALVAEDRRAQNIVPDMSVRENLMLASMGQHRGFGRGYSARAETVKVLMDQLGLPADRMDTNLLNFSGGMQQKIIIARWLLTQPQVLILDEPTKGVDIGTRSSIYKILQKTADQGVAVVVISSDFEELLGICERVVVISDGLTIANLPVEKLTEEKLTLLAAPRTSAERNSVLLRQLSEEYSGHAFWTLIDHDELICLASVTAPNGPDAGLKPGTAILASETSIPQALANRQSQFVNDGSLSSLLIQMTDTRGHDLGWIGLTVAADAPRPPIDTIKASIARLSHSQQED